MTERSAQNLSQAANTDGSPPPRLFYRILGPLEVRLGSTDHTPRTPKLTHVLAVLLLNANTVVPLRELVDDLWPTPPKLAKKTVQTYVYQLRRHLGQVNELVGGQLIETHPNGYRIVLHRSQLDLWEFDDLVEKGLKASDSGDHRTAASLFRGALDMWRGDPLSNVEFGVGTAAKVASLEDRRTEVLERWISTELALGRHRSLVSTLTEITTRNPLHEMFCAQLMTAALRSGLRNVALDAYRRLRRAMVDDLGLEPSAQLRQLQQEALDSAFVAQSVPEYTDRFVTARPPGQLPADTSDLVGREDETVVLVERGSQDELIRSPGAAVLVVGAPGIGKTVLAIHAAQWLRGNFPDGQLYAEMHDADGRPADPAAVLMSFLRSLGLRDDEVPDRQSERANMFRTLVTGGRFLVVLDDVASGEQILPLLPSCEGCLVIVTARHRIPELSFIHIVELGAMTLEDGVELLRRIVGTDRIGREPDAARDVVELCDRLPLAVRIAGQKLVARRAWQVRKLADRLADEERRITELGVGTLDLGKYLEGVVDRLATPDRQALVTLAGLGSGWFDLAAAAAALGVDPLAAESPVGTLVNEHLLEVAPIGPGSLAAFRFPELFRLYAVHGSGVRGSSRLSEGSARFR